MKTLNKIFLSRYDLFVKYLRVGQMIYLEKMCAKPFSHAGIGY